MRSPAGSPSSRAAPGAPCPPLGIKGGASAVVPTHGGQGTFPGLVAFLGTASLAGSVPAAASPRSPGMHTPDPFPLPGTPKTRDRPTWEPHRGDNGVGGGSPWRTPDHPQSSCSPRGTLGSQQLPQPQFRRFWTIWKESHTTATTVITTLLGTFVFLSYSLFF